MLLRDIILTQQSRRALEMLAVRDRVAREEAAEREKREIRKAIERKREEIRKEAERKRREWRNWSRATIEFASTFGWAITLPQIPKKFIYVLDHHKNPSVGELIELRLPEINRRGRFLRALCPRNGIIIEGVPDISDIDGLPITTALAAQAWRIGDPLSEYIQPPRRT